MKRMINLDQEDPNSMTDSQENSEITSSITRAFQRFKCDVCFKLFSSKQCLKEHKFIHTNEKPYVCNICKKKFRHASQFAMHKKAHGSKSDMIWPKLTDLMKNLPATKVQKLEYMEKVNLPLITNPYKCYLPMVNELRRLE